MVVYATARPAIQMIQVGWAELLAYALIPVSATLTILYRSDARHDLSGLTRLGYLFLVSCTIFVVVCLAVATAICIACIFVGLARQH